MEKKLEKLRWHCMWVSHLGCIKGCLEYLGIDVSPAWLFGATGHAFILNIHEDVCPSGPTAWNTEMLFKLAKNIGYIPDMIFGIKNQPNFAEKQQLAWEKIKQAINQDLPCYGWELDIPEFYVIYGYDDIGYYFSGAMCDEGKGPKPWNELGKSDIGVLELCILKPGQASNDVIIIKEAFQFVLEYATSPDKWIFQKYKSGLAGYDNWIRALENGKAHDFGLAYNSVVWSECRYYAVEFLKEAKPRMGNKTEPLFSEAIDQYSIISQNLKKVSELFPFPRKGMKLKIARNVKMRFNILNKQKMRNKLD